MDIGGLVAGNEVGLINQIGRFDRSFAETQVRHGKTAGLFGVIGKIGLRIEIGVIADNFDCVLVCAYSAVGTEAEELALYGAFGDGIEVFAHFKGKMRHVIFNTHGEVVLGACHQHIVEHGPGHGRGEFFGTEAVAPGKKFGEEANLFALFHKSGTHVLVQRFTRRAGFFGAIQYGDGFHSGGQYLKHEFSAEGAVQVHFHQTHALSLSVQVVHRFFDHVAGGTHGDDHPVGVGRSIVIKRLVGAAGDGGYALHGVDHDGRNVVIEGVAGFAVLEIGVRVLGRAALAGMLGVQRAGAEVFHVIPVHDLADIFIINDINLADFMRGAEAVKEVAERYAGINGREMGHKAEIHGFLRVVGTQESKAGLAGCHDVLMVAKDGQSMRGQSAGRNMEDAGQKFAGNLVHVGDHEQQTLGGCEGRRQCASGKAAVHGAGRARFGLHFTHSHGLPHEIFHALGGPFVHVFSHDGRRGNGVDCGSVAQGIGDVRCGVVAVHSFGMLCHVILLNCRKRIVRSTKQRRHSA